MEGGRWRVGKYLRSLLGMVARGERGKGVRVEYEKSVRWYGEDGGGRRRTAKDGGGEARTWEMLCTCPHMMQRTCVAWLV